MNDTAPRNVFVEQALYLAGWLRLCRSKKTYSEELGVEVCQEIHAEELAKVNDGRDEAHMAEVGIGDGIAAIDEATRVDSEGGPDITKNEWKRIRPRFVAAKEHAHNATDILTTT